MENEVYDIAEHMEIEKIVAERIWNKTEPIKMISWEEMKEALRKRGKNISVSTGDIKIPKRIVAKVDSNKNSKYNNEKEKSK